jgi:DNA-binding response OmpR family regulator
MQPGLVVVVEDDPAIGDVQRRYLVAAGFGVHVERDGRTGLEAIRRMRPVAMVLDVGLPSMDGIEICRTLRSENDWTPLLFVTARDDEVDRVLGLELGADDYLTKPFSPRELVARIKSVLRRQAGPPSPVREVGRVRLDETRREVRVDDQPISLTATEFDLLAKLMSAPGRVFTREQLLSSVWGQADYGGGRTVDVHVAQVRSKLGDACPITTRRGVGYSAEAPRE